MELPYIQDIIGDEKETPIAPFAKAREKNIVAYVMKRYKNDKLVAACLHYYNEDGKHIFKGHTCSNWWESSFENIFDKNGQQIEQRCKTSRGEEKVYKRRKLGKKIDTFREGYLSSRFYPRAKLLETFCFSEERGCIYYESIDDKQYEVIKIREAYDSKNRILSLHYIWHAKDNPAEVYDQYTKTYYYPEDYEEDQNLSHVICTRKLGADIVTYKNVLSDHDDHGNWRTKHYYEVIQGVESRDDLIHIEKQEIAYSHEDLQKLEDSYAEAVYYINTHEYDDMFDYDDATF